MNTPPIAHELKSWSQFFQAIKSGARTSDMRNKSDREFEVGQFIMLREYDPFCGLYTGESLTVEVTHIIDNVTPCALSSNGLAKDHVVLSLRSWQEPGVDDDLLEDMAKALETVIDGEPFDVIAYRALLTRYRATTDGRAAPSDEVA